MLHSLWQREAVLNHLTLSVVVQDLVDVQELGGVLNEHDFRQNRFLEVVLEQEVAGEVRLCKALKSLLEFLNISSLSIGEVLIVRVDAVVFLNDVLKVIYHCGNCINLVSIYCSFLLLL